MSASYTCVSCQVAFANSDLQRQHHKSDWHRYNLKRKVVHLPPVSAQIFSDRILTQQALHSLQMTNTSHVCHACHKNFGSVNAYDNHLRSKKHQLNASKKLEVDQTAWLNKRNEEDSKRNIPVVDEVMEDDDSSEWSSCDEEEIDDDEELPPVDVAECLFCDVRSDSLEKNVDHMTVNHSFFIPDVEYLADLTGLLQYLAWKVGIGKLCFWCNSKKSSFHSKQAVQQHMVDKGHCKLFLEGDKIMEFADFYDYSSSYPDTQEEEEAEADIPQLDGDDWQLVLPSGTIIGHRSLSVYYKQNVPQKRVCQKAVNRLVSQYKALGWTGTTGEAAVRKARDVQFMEKIRNKRMLKTGMKHNSCKQKHFRNQVMF